jgi:hypothetical protein
MGRFLLIDLFAIKKQAILECHSVEFSGERVLTASVAVGRSATRTKIASNFWDRRREKGESKTRSNEAFMAAASTVVSTIVL